MAHPHVKAIEEMEFSKLLDIVRESKMTYVRENLSIFLHESQIKLLKQVKKHEKPHHKRIRIRQYEKADKTNLFKMHEEKFLKRYNKLAKKGLIEVDENPDNGLPYDCKLTDEGKKILSEIDSLEKEWEEVVGVSEDDLKTIKNLALNSFEITYRHKKKLNFNF
jgi:DNA-binding MarR family transcriptional regulator